MLVFHGIKFQFNSPTKFYTRLYLIESLRLALQRLQVANNEFPDAINALESGISQGSSSSASVADIRKHTAISLRAKDILRFLENYREASPVIQLFTVLVQEESVEVCWSKIKPIFLQLFQSQNSVSAQDFLLSVGSPVYPLVEAIHLFFLDLIPERPPANLMLSLFPGNFPGHSWTSTDTVAEREIIDWRPTNPLGDKTKLLAGLISYLQQPETGIALGAGSAGQKPQSGSVRHGISPLESFSAQETFISLGDMFGERAVEELPMQESMDEVLLHFQRTIAKKCKQPGLRFLSALLREIYRQPNEITCRLHPEGFIREVCGKAALSSVKNKQILKKVLDAFLAIEISRIYQVRGALQARRNHLLTPLSKVGGFDNDTRSMESDSETEYVKDAVLMKDGTNLKPPGYALRFLPKSFFQHERSLPHYYEIGSMLINTWYDDYQEQTGTARISAVDIIDRAGILMSRTQMYRTVREIKETLGQMREDKFVGFLNFNADSSDNIKEQVYEISAGEEPLALIADEYGGSNPALTI